MNRPGMDTFVIRVVKRGRRWHAHISHNAGVLGESGSTTYRSRTPERCVRKAMRTVSGIVASDHILDARVHITYEPGAWG